MLGMKMTDYSSVFPSTLLKSFFSTDSASAYIISFYLLENILVSEIIRMNKNTEIAGYKNILAINFSLNSRVSVSWMFISAYSKGVMIENKNLAMKIPPGTNKGRNIIFHRESYVFFTGFGCGMSGFYRKA